MKSLKFITALHGNEYMPVLALASQNIPQIVANPKALSLNQRFIDMDMNKAFNLEGSSYEQKMAAKVLAQLSPKDLVIDFHSTTAKTDPFAIITDLKMVDFAATL